MTKSQKIGLVLGIVLIVAFIFINPILTDDLFSYVVGSAVILLFNVVSRLFAAVFCFSVANSLKRNSIIWMAFGILTPPIALIAIAFVKPKKEKI